MIKNRTKDSEPLETITIRVPAEFKLKCTKEAEALDMNRSDYIWHMMSPVSPYFLRQLVLLNSAFLKVDYMSCRDNDDVRQKNQNVYEAFEKLMVEYFGEEWFDPSLDKDHLLEQLNSTIEVDDLIEVISGELTKDKGSD